MGRFKPVQLGVESLRDAYGNLGGYVTHVWPFLLLSAAVAYGSALVYPLGPALLASVGGAVTSPADAIMIIVTNIVQDSAGVVLVFAAVAFAAGPAGGNAPQIEATWRRVGTAVVGAKETFAMLVGLQLLTQVPAVLMLAFGLGSPSAAAGVGVVSLVITVIAVYYLLRWSLSIAAVFRDQTAGTRPGWALSRSAQLTRGNLVAVLIALVVAGIPGFLITGTVSGIWVGSNPGAIFAMLPLFSAVITVVSGLLVMPPLAAAQVRLYDALVSPGPEGPASPAFVPAQAPPPV